MFRDPITYPSNMADFVLGISIISGIRDSSEIPLLSLDRVLTITSIGHQVHDWASLEFSSLCGKIQSRSPEKSLQLILKDECEQNNDLTGGQGTELVSEKLPTHFTFKGRIRKYE